MWKYSVNENYFSELSPENCYWGGLLASDGWLYNNNNNIGLRLSDTEHIDSFKSYVGYTGPVREGVNIKQDGSLGKSYKEIRVSCRKWKQDLNQHFNITPNKTYTLSPPNIEEEKHVVSYLVGLVDGDGSVITHKQTGNTIIRFLGTEILLNWVKNWVDFLVPSKGTTSATVRQHKPDCEFLRRYEISGRRSTEFFSLVEPLGVPYMKRKWNKLASF